MAFSTRHASSRIVPPSTMLAMPCFYRIFDQRLQQQRRHQCRFAFGRDLLLHAQPAAKAYLLHSQVVVRQSQFFAQANRLAFTHTQAAAQKVGEAHAHFACPRGVDAR